MAATTATRRPVDGKMENMEDTRRSKVTVAAVAAAAAAMAMTPQPPRNILGKPPGTFEVAVIGLGMIGAATARHMSKILGSSVVAIGPPEPESVTVDGPFGSYYDQGRLTRVTDPDPVWAELAANSMSRYDDLEKISGIKFHFPVGSIRVEPAAKGAVNSLAQSFHVGKSHRGIGMELIKSRRRLRKLFPWFGFRHGEAAVVEGGAAGYINPRAMVAAQIKAAEFNGACVVREAVTEITPLGYGVCVKTTNGRTFWASKVVICAGAYTPELLPCKRLKRLDMRCYGRTVLMAEVDKMDAARLAQMPTFIWRLPPGGHLSWVYGCPPVEYPDGRLFLKMGGTAYDAPEVGGDALGHWFRVPCVDVECTSAVHVVEQSRHALSSFTHAIPHSAHASEVDHPLDGLNINLTNLSINENDHRLHFLNHRLDRLHQSDFDSKSLDLDQQLEFASRLEFLALASTFAHLFPNTLPISFQSKQCVVAFTAHGRPYIDAVDGIRSPSNARVFVAAGGCGAAAKSSDEIGRLAAELVINSRWNYHLDHSLFRSKFKPL